MRSAADFAWLPDAVEGAVRLARSGYVLAVVSNQRGVARGLVTTSVLAEIEEKIQEELALHGVRIEAFRYCPHDTNARCACRKPKPGMLVDLARELGVDLARSWMIGDSEDDVLAGQAAGCRTALVGSAASGARPDLEARSLLEASAEITRARAASPGRPATSAPRSPRTP